LRCARDGFAERAALLAGETQRLALPAFGRAQALFFARNIVASHRHNALPFGELDLKDH
jgi:hypothetical protein